MTPLTPRTALRPMIMLLGIVAGVSAPPVHGQETEAKTLESQAEQRFVVDLERNPRRGAALDSIYGFHVERGTLEQFLKTYADRCNDPAADEQSVGTAWMIRGLVAARRGNHAAAVEAFTAAEAKLSDSPLASCYLGQSLLLAGRPQEAVAACERAIARKPARDDLLDVYQTLGRVYLRMQKPDEVQQVWNRLESLLPNDLRVQERIAQTLVEEGDFAAALSRFEGLASKAADGDMRWQYRMAAADLNVRLGKADAAITDYREVFKLNPALLVDRLESVQRAFRQVNRVEEFLDLLEGLDFSSFQNNPYQVSNALRNSAGAQGHAEQILRILQKAWKDLPQQREQLLDNFYSDEAMLKRPEFLQMVRETVIPGDAAPTDPWAGINRIRSFGPDGRVSNLATQLLQSVAGSKQLDDLAARVAAAREKHPSWTGGAGLAGLIDCRRGQRAAGRKSLAALLDDMNPPPGMACFVLGQELSEDPEARDVAVRFYELGLTSIDGSNWEYSYHPARRLVALYRQAGEPAKARAVVLKVAQIRSDNYDPEYAAYRRIQNEMSVGDELLTLGYPVEAILRYNALVNEPQLFQIAGRYGSNRTLASARQSFQKAVAAIRAEDISVLLESATRQPSPERGFDLLLVFESRELDRIRLTSVLASVLRSADASPDALQKVRAFLDGPGGKSKDDLHAQVLGVLSVLHAGTDDERTLAVGRLVAGLAGRPLPGSPAGRSGTDADRTAAARQVGLWLVARECLASDALREAGTTLGERALHAARGQSDPGYVRAILREWGQLDLDRGDREQAAARWRDLLDSVFPAGGDRAAPQAPAATAQAAPEIAAPAAASSGPVPTIDRFEECLQLARLAAEHRFVDLALDATLRTLSRGTPLSSRLAESDAGSVIRATATADGELGEIHRRVLDRCQELEPLLLKAGATDAQMFELFSAIILPEHRPQEVFLYERPLNASLQGGLASVSELAARLAVTATRAEELKVRLAERQSNPLGRTAGAVALIQLARATNNAELLTQELKSLNDQLANETSAHAQELAGHAVLPLLDRQDDPAEAIELLERAVKGVAAAAQSRGELAEEPTRSMRFALARMYFQRGDAANGKRQFEEYIAFLRPLYSRYAGDYGLYRTRLDLQAVAVQLERFGCLPEALEVLGRAADYPEMPQYGGGQAGAAGGMLVRLQALPPAERYSMLKTWSWPVADRPTLRHFIGMLPDAAPPAVFTGMRLRNVEDPLISSLELLLDAAREAGSLDELAAEVARLVSAGVEGAELLQLLVDLEQANDARSRPALLARIELRQKSPPDPGNAGRWSPDLTDELVLRAAIRRPEMRDLGVQLHGVIRGHARTARHYPAMLRLDRTGGLAKIAANGATLKPSADPGLKHWNPLDLENASQRTAGGAPSWWLALEDRIGHVSSPSADFLAFAYPLTGTFEISCEAFNGGWAEMNLGFSGLMIEAWSGATGTQIYPLNHHESLQRPDPVEFREHFGPLTLKVRPDRLQLIGFNDQIVYEDSGPSPISPFLTLRTTWPSAVRNLKISGNPVIPRELPLLAGDRLEGWMSNFYNESQPPRLTIGQPLPGNQPGTVTRDRDPDAYDWSASDGVLHGRRFAELTTDSRRTGYRHGESWIYYHRPLRNRERIQYEFFYQPDGTELEVHPTLDRLVFLLEPAGVRLHWLTANRSREETGAWLATDNVAEEPACRRGPGPLPLKANEWNAAAVELADGMVRVELNGRLVYERPLERDWGTRFGFYHDRSRTAARVRHVVLTGDWPEWSPRLAASLLERTTPIAVQDADAIRDILGPRLTAADSTDDLAEILALPASERYDRLARLVLPTTETPHFRMTCMFTPVGRSPLARRQITPAQPLPREPGDSRAQPGGEFLSPAIELVDAAKAAGRLDELTVALAVPPQTLFDERSRKALAAIVAVVREDLPTAEQRLRSLLDGLAAVELETLAHERTPEAVAACAALRQPALARFSEAIFSRMLDQSRSGRRDDAWERLLTTLLEQARQTLHGAPSPAYPSRSQRGQWAQVNYPSIENRYRGRTGRWSFASGLPRHIPGEGHDYLIYHQPLRGTFQIEAELSTFGHRECRLDYGGIWCGPHYTKNRYSVGGINWRKDPELKPPMENLQSFHQARFDVSPTGYRAYLNGRLFHEQPLDSGADPWVAVQTHDAAPSEVRSIRITGTPEVPAELDLIDCGISSWWIPIPDRVNQSHFHWKIDDGQLIHARLTSNQGPPAPSIACYRRPMLEDGAIEFEFFYEPDKSLVHPALDRLAFLLTPEGVVEHWISDGALDRTGTPLDNRQVRADCRRGTPPLQLVPGADNKLRLELHGDVVTLRLNDAEIYVRTLDAGHERRFGLFHRAEQSEVKVRNIRYAGDWPKTFVPVAQQEFAAGSFRTLPAAADEYDKTWDLRRGLPRGWKLSQIVPNASTVNPSPDGLKITLLPTRPEQQIAAGIAMPADFAGDFELTLNYRDLQGSTPRKEPDQGHKYPGFDFRLSFQDSVQTGASFQVRDRGSAGVRTGCVAAYQLAGTRKFEGTFDKPLPSSGRLRFIRRGGTLHYLCADGPEAEFVPLEQLPIGAAMLQEVGITLSAYHPGARVDLTVEELKVRAVETP